MTHPETWNPFTDWKPVNVDWVRVKISQEDLRRFNQRSNLMGFCYAIGFLLCIVATGAAAYWAFSEQRWILMAVALYLHGIVFSHLGEAMHELGHGTVFASRRLNHFFMTLFGILYWPGNPFLYKLSHLDYHHRYTLYQGSDGEDSPNYLELTPKLIFQLFIGIFQIRAFVLSASRLLTLKPTSMGWRGHGYQLDNWEKFILQKASDKDRRQVYRLALYALIAQVLFVAVCLYWGQWFLIVLVTLAPFYFPGFHSFVCAVHQHTACQANCPDFRLSCADAVLDPISSFLHWHMEYHIEHHMYASIPCYNLKKFSRFVADQLPAKENAVTRVWKLHRLCKEKYGTMQNWRDHFGRFRGV